MEILLDDYKRKLKTIEDVIDKNTNNGSRLDIERKVRLDTKASEYRAFIVDIERAIQRNKKEGFSIGETVIFKGVETYELIIVNTKGFIEDGELFIPCANKNNEIDDYAVSCLFKKIIIL